MEKKKIYKGEKLPDFELMDSKRAKGYQEYFEKVFQTEGVDQRTSKLAYNPNDNLKLKSMAKN